MALTQTCPAGRAIVRWLDEQGKTQTWLASELGVSHAQLFRWLAGQRTPRVETCVAIERITGVPARRWAERKAAA